MADISNIAVPCILTYFFLTVRIQSQIPAKRSVVVVGSGVADTVRRSEQIARASCREREEISVVAVAL